MPKYVERAFRRQRAAPAAAAAPSFRFPARDLCAMLLARLIESFSLLCPQCGADRPIVAFITPATPVARILKHIGEPAEPPPIAPAHGPHAWDHGLELLPDWEALAQPESLFDPRIPW